MNIAKGIKLINPNAQFTIENDDYNTIVWLNETNPISLSDIETKLNQTDYIGKRQAEYPSWQDQMDMMWHDKKDDTTTWEDAVQAVKDAHPKP